MPLRAPLLRALRPYRPSVTWGFLVAGSIIFINDNLYETTFIEGRSMAPTLSPEYDATRAKDAVLWKKWKPTANLARGDLVHFANPTKPEARGVKRVIGLEGDTVVLDARRRPEMNSGVQLSEAVAWDAWKGSVRVPPGHVWVEGDNWRKSKDSNWYGPISKSLIDGKPVAVVWPPGRYWTKPWVGFQSRTKVVEGREVGDWTEGLPIELAEIGEPHAPP